MTAPEPKHIALVAHDDRKGDLLEWAEYNRDILADHILYATGTKARPSLSFYDAGEGQLPADFPRTFCSLIYGSDEGSYKGAVPFAQGRFNMGGTGVLPFGNGMTRPTLIDKVEPTYTREAIAAHVGGVAILKCVIKEDGSLERCRMIKGIPHMDQVTVAGVQVLF